MSARLTLSLETCPASFRPSASLLRLRCRGLCLLRVEGVEGGGDSCACARDQRPVVTVMTCTLPQPMSEHGWPLV